MSSRSVEREYGINCAGCGRSFQVRVDSGMELESVWCVWCGREHDLRGAQAAMSRAQGFGPQHPVVSISSLRPEFFARVDCPRCRFRTGERDFRLARALSGDPVFQVPLFRLSCERCGQVFDVDMRKG